MWIILNNRASLAEVRTGGRLCHSQHAGQATDARRSGRRNNVPDFNGKALPGGLGADEVPSKGVPEVDGTLDRGQLSSAERGDPMLWHR